MKIKLNWLAIFIFIALMSISLFPCLSEAATITVPTDYGTIQGAINAASNGDTILVNYGTYYENIVVNKTVNLVGVPDFYGDKPVVNGLGDYDGFSVTSDGVLLQGFNIYNISRGIFIGSNNTNVSENSVSGGKVGIDIVGSGNIVSGNRAGSNINGIELDHGSSNNTVSGNEGVQDTNAFIIDTGAHNNNITGNTAIENVYGFYVSGSGNYIDQNVIGNISQYYYYNGDFYKSYDYNNVGIYINNSSGNFLWSNLLLGNTANVEVIGAGANYWNSTAPTTFTYNGQTITSYTGNYWGDYSGPDNNGDGIGDTPYTLGSNVDNYPMILLNASFTVTHGSGLASLTVLFNDTSVGGPEAWNWNFGDNSPIVTDQNVTHLYSVGGAYDVVLTITKGHQISMTGAHIIANVAEEKPVKNLRNGRTFDVIQEAINDANTIAGDTIQVNSGTYYENVVVNKTISLVGVDTGSGQPVVDGHNGNFAINVTADGVTVHGFNVFNASWGIYIDSNYNNVTMNTATGYNNGGGIYLHGSTHNNISGNNVSNVGSTGIFLGYYSVQDYTGNYIGFYSSYNNVTGNAVNNNVGGIYIDYGSNNNVSRNIVNNNSGSGISLYYGSGNNMSENTVNGNSYGISLSDEYNDSLSGNTLNNNVWYGIYLDTSHNNILRNNSISGSSYCFSDYWSSVYSYKHYNDVDTSNLVDGKPIYYLVDASDVIIGNSSNAGTVYLVNCSNVTIRDLALTNNYYGVYFDASSNCLIENVSATFDTNGIWLGSGSNGNTVSRSNASNSAWYCYGIYVDGSFNAVTGNIASGTVLGDGIYIIGSNNSVTGNTANDNECGIYFSGSGTNVSGNTANNNQNGLIIIGSDNNVSGNMADYNGYGIELIGTGNSISGNTANNNYWYAIDIGYKDNSISGNTANNNNQYGIEISGTGNSISGNTANNNQYGIYLPGSYDNVLRNNTMAGNQFDFEDYLPDPMTYNNVDTSNLVDGKPIYYLVNASDVIIGSSSNAGTVYLVNCSNVTIRDLTLTNNYYGAYLGGSSNCRVQNTNASVDQYGIYLHGSSYNDVTGNVANDNNCCGIFLDYYSIYDNGWIDYYSSYNNILGNTASGNNVSYMYSPMGSGIYLFNDLGNNVSGNLADSNVYGIVLYNSSCDNVSGNTVNYNENDGIGMYSGSANNSVSGNTVNANSMGIYITGSNYNNVSRNTANRGNYGIYISGSSYDYVMGNTANSNVYDGIHLDYSMNNNLMGNTADNNGKGISLDESSNNIIWLNQFVGNQGNSRLYYMYSEGLNYWNSTSPLKYTYKGHTYTNYTGNYWGDYNGTNSNGDGIGDSPYTIGAVNVDYYPMISNSTVISQPAPELLLSMSAPSSMLKGENMEYSLYYSNWGNKGASGVTLSDPLPGEVVFVSASDGGVYYAGNHTVVWDVGTLSASGGYGSRTVDITVPRETDSGFIINNTAFLAASGGYAVNASAHTEVVGPTLPAGVWVTGINDYRLTSSVSWEDPISFSYNSSMNVTGVDINIHLDDDGADIAGSMAGGPPTWSYATTFYPRHGNSNVTYTVHYANATSTSVEFNIYVDPAGYIYDVTTGARIANATVWLQRPDGYGGWENVPTGQSPAVMQPDENPLITNADGQYQWNTLNGTYRVHVEAPGYYPADSIVVNVPPPVTDLNVGLTPIVHTFTLSLEKGWNLVSSPIVIDPAINVSTFKGTNVTMVAQYNLTSGGFDIYRVGKTPVAFPFVEGRGYFLYCDNGTGYTINGSDEPDQSTAIVQGWNLIGWTNLTATNSKTLAQGLQNVTMLARYNTTSGSYDIYRVGKTPTPFEIKAGEGYFLYTTYAGQQTLATS